MKLLLKGAFLCLAACRLGGWATAQDMTRARTTLQTLTAPGFHGRGYVSNGDRIAAGYLRGRFANMGLRSFDSSYFQPFMLDINTFPGKVALRTGRRRWVPGKEFIVSAISQAGKGRVIILPLDRRIFSDTSARNAFLRQDLKRTMVTYAAADYGQFTDDPDLLEKLHTAKALVQLEKEKLTAGVSTAALSHPTFEVVRKDWDSTARKARFRVDAELVKNYPTQNVIGYVPGKTHPDEFIAVTAHYDHLGRMGRDVYFPGANDNASGVTLLLELAEHYARPENRPDHSVVFMCFAAEEAGLLGSKHYTDKPLFPLTQIKFLINLDLLGTGGDGVMVVNGLRLEPEFALLTRLNEEKKYLPKLQKRDNAPNSDHFFFTRRGVRACFFYTLGGPRFYHDVNDRAETLPLTKFREVFRLITDFIGEYP